MMVTIAIQENLIISIQDMGLNTMTINKGLFTSNTDLWATPQDFFDKLNTEFSFTLDVCATPENTKCPDYYTEEQDGLSKKWTGRVWCNPPYGRKIREWIKKGHDSIQNGEAELVVMLIPSRTDTAYWHDYVMKGNIRFIRGRLKFGNSKNSAPFPSAIVIFKGA